MLGGVATLRPVLSMMMMVIPRPERSAQRRAVAPEFREDFANTRCFVENLSKNTDWAALKDHFKAEGYPVIYASVSSDRDGSSKGCGIVQFETVHAAQHAIDFMKGTLLDGQDINIRPDFQEQSRRTAAGPNDDHFESRGDLGRRDRRDDTGASSRSRLGGFSRAAGDTAPVDIPLVESLLSERTELRKRRDFDGADAIREELRRMGIGVDDKARTWVAMGRGGSGAPGGDDANGRKGRAERSEDERDAQPWMSKPWTRVEGTDDGREVDEAEVLLRLAARDDARERRDFVGADSILEELIRMGVGVDDARRGACVLQPPMQCVMIV
jgi:RNA recognition motif-containing protein